MRKIKYLFSAAIIVLLCCMVSFAHEAETLEDYITYTAKMIGTMQSDVMPMSMEGDSRFSCKRLQVEFSGNAYLPDTINPVDYVTYESTAVFSFSTALDTEEAYNTLLNMPDVKSVLVDQIITVDSVVEGVEPAGNYENIQATLDTKNWGIEAVHASDYKKYVSSRDAGEVVVGIIDTGLAENHPYFKDSGRVITGYNLTTPALPVHDYKGHGTHVAGVLMASSTDNVKIKMYQIFNEYNLASNILLNNAIKMAVEDGVDVINLSLTTICENGFCHEALDKAYEAGIIVVVASGNGGTDEIADPVADVCLGHYSEHIITVGAVNSSLVADKYSNYGPEVDICAPGTNIYSTYYVHATNVLGYATSTGTSMATPFVSSFAAMMKSIQSDLTFEQFCLSMNESALKQDGWDSTKNGVGILNMGQSSTLIENIFAHSVQFIKDEELGETSFELKLENNSENTVDFMILLTFYNENGIQVGSDIECYSIKSGKKTSYSVPIEQMPDGATTVKGFVWTDGLEPMSMGREYLIPIE